jgi:DNA-binding transcriptional ArsR family regulator
MNLGMRSNARSLEYSLGWLIAGTKGGPTRAKIIKALKQASLNTNQIAIALKISYKTAEKNLEVLEKNKIVTTIADKGGITTYFLSQTMQDNYAIFEKLSKNVVKKQRKIDRSSKDEVDNVRQP